MFKDKTKVFLMYWRCLEKGWVKLAGAETENSS